MSDSTPKTDRLRELAASLGDLLASKQAQYGDSVGATSEILRQLYPDGIALENYDGLQLVVRILDKLKRVATHGLGQDLGRENPMLDVAGYGLLGVELAERRALDAAEAASQRESVAAGVRREPDDLETIARQTLYQLVIALGLYDSIDAFEDRVWGAAAAPASYDEILAWVLAAVRDGVLGCGNADWVRERVAARSPDWRMFDAAEQREPTSDGCTGCKFLVRVSVDGLPRQVCRRTNRPTRDAVVYHPELRRPSWCPGREESTP